MKKIILIFILVQASLFANEDIGIGYSLSSVKLTDETKISIKSYSIYTNKISNNYIFKGSIAMVPSQAPISKRGVAYNNITMKGYGYSMSLAYKLYNENTIFIAPNISLGYASTTIAINNIEKETTVIPLLIGIVIGVDYKKDSTATISYDFFNINLEDSFIKSDDSPSSLSIGLSHSINKNFSVQSSYSIGLNNVDGTKSITVFNIGVGYSF